MASACGLRAAFLTLFIASSFGAKYAHRLANTDIFELTAEGQLINSTASSDAESNASQAQQEHGLMQQVRNASEATGSSNILEGIESQALHDEESMQEVHNASASPDGFTPRDPGWGCCCCEKTETEAHGTRYKCCMSNNRQRILGTGWCMNSDCHVVYGAGKVGNTDLSTLSPRSGKDEFCKAQYTIIKPLPWKQKPPAWRKVFGDVDLNSLIWWKDKGFAPGIRINQNQINMLPAVAQQAIASAPKVMKEGELLFCDDKNVGPARFTQTIYPDGSTRDNYLPWNYAHGEPVRSNPPTVLDLYKKANKNGPVTPEASWYANYDPVVGRHAPDPEKIKETERSLMTQNDWNVWFNKLKKTDPNRYRQILNDPNYEYSGFLRKHYMGQQ